MLLINVDNLIGDLIVFLPEVVLCVAIIGLLLVRMAGATTHLGSLALAAVLAALAAQSVMWMTSEIHTEVPAFTGMLVCDPFLMFARFLILGAAALTIMLSLLTGIPDREDSGDFNVLLLGGTLGMLLMASANHLLMAFMAVEMASLPSYALAGFLKGKRQSSEASLKYVVYGGGASGVMLYGISLIVGKFGTGYLPDVAFGYAAVFNQHAATGGVDAVLVMGTLFLLIGLSFKLSVVPFHFWCPDVFEGAAAEIGAFLSVASKAGAFILTARVLLTIATTPLLSTDLMIKTFAPPLAFIAALTATYGNLAAYPQNNLKRLLAYSTIAHAGYMLMGLAVLNSEGAQAVLFYLATYVFMNLGAFAIIAFVRNKSGGSEDINAFRGLMYRSPILAVLMGVFILSLLGIPPLAGFVAKFQIFAAVYHAGAAASTPWLANVFFALLVIGGLNTAFSAFYYMRIVKAMVFEQPVEALEGQPVPPLNVSVEATTFIGALGAVVLAMGLVVNPVLSASHFGVRTFAPQVFVQTPNPPRGGPGRGQPKGQPKAQPKVPAKGGTTP